MNRFSTRTIFCIYCVFILCQWLPVELNQCRRHAGPYMWNLNGLMLQGECVMLRVSSFPFFRLSVQHVMPSGHASSWLHIGCVKICRKGKWQRCFVLTPAALTPALWAFPTAEPNRFRQTEGWVVAGLSIVHSCCFAVLVLTKTRQRDLGKPVSEMCLHCKSQEATCFSVPYLLYFTGLWATSQLN